MRHSPPPTLATFTAAVLRVSNLLTSATEAQWQAGNSPVPREDTTERSKGLTSDPTPNIVTDPRRLALRTAVIAAELELTHAGRALQTAEHNLEVALKKWQG